MGGWIGLLIAAISAVIQLIQQNPVFQGQMKELTTVLQADLVPLIKGSEPTIKSLAEGAQKMLPLMEIIGHWLKVISDLAVSFSKQFFEPFLDITKALVAAMNNLSQVFHDAGGSLGTGSGSGSGGNFFDPGGLGKSLGFAGGGAITADRMFGFNPATGGGFIYAHAGENVVSRQGAGGGTSITINEAFSARDTAEKVRLAQDQLAAYRRGR